MAAFDAAIHDAAGMAVRSSALSFYETDAPIPSADTFFERGTIPAIWALLLDSPRRTSPAWWIVGKRDDLEGEVRRKVESEGFRCFKVKIAGKDNAADVQQVVDLHLAIRQWGG